jgi:hypothetical protein
MPKMYGVFPGNSYEIGNATWPMVKITPIIQTSLVWFPLSQALLLGHSLPKTKKPDKKMSRFHLRNSIRMTLKADYQLKRIKLK